jgi:hypothetical protein
MIFRNLLKESMRPDFSLPCSSPLESERALGLTLLEL